MYSTFYAFRSLEYTDDIVEAYDCQDGFYWAKYFLPLQKGNPGEFLKGPVYLSLSNDYEIVTLAFSEGSEQLHIATVVRLIPMCFKTSKECLDYFSKKDV